MAVAASMPVRAVHMIVRMAVMVMRVVVRLVMRGRGVCRHWALPKCIMRRATAAIRL